MAIEHGIANTAGLSPPTTFVAVGSKSSTRAGIAASAVKSMSANVWVLHSLYAIDAANFILTLGAPYSTPCPP